MLAEFVKATVTASYFLAVHWKEGTCNSLGFIMRFHAISNIGLAKAELGRNLWNSGKKALTLS